MKKLKDLSFNFKKKFFFSRVKKNNLKGIIKFFNIHSGVKIHKKFYIHRYFNGKKFNSFICYTKSKIIAHVGYVQYSIKSGKRKIYSRHSSVVDINYRNKKIYSNLLDYSFKNLKQIDSFLFWPNNNNKKKNFKKIKKKFFYKIKNNLIFFNSNKNINKNLKKLTNLKLFNQYYLLNTYDNIIYKDLTYFKKRYFGLKYNKYYYDVFEDESLAIFTENKVNKDPILIELIGNKNKKREHLKYLSKNFKFYYCVHPSKIINYKKFTKFEVTNIKFNLFYLTNKKLNLKNYDIQLSDTDSFMKTI